MSFEISGMNNAKLQAWATKCDANKDGKIDDNEMSIFEQGKENMFIDDKNRTKTTIDGVTFFTDDIKTIKKNNDKNGYDNTVVFESGAKVEYDKQFEDNEAVINSGLSGGITHTYIVNLSDKKGFKASGTKRNDLFRVSNSKISELNGKSGIDTMYISNSVGSKDTNKQFDSDGTMLLDIGNIYGEKVYIFNSDSLSAQENNKNLLRDKQTSIFVKQNTPNGNLIYNSGTVSKRPLQIEE